jgi:hypothetical protein
MTSTFSLLDNALALDKRLTSGPFPVPDVVIDLMAQLRRQFWHLGMDIDHEIRQHRARDQNAIRSKLDDVNRRLARGWDRPTVTRAQATTKAAHLGQLARIRDGLKDELREIAS